jgi:hypothetical protein
VANRTVLRDVGSVIGYEHQVGIAVPLNNAETTGLPSSAENGQLDEIEDAVCGSLEEGAESLFVVAVTTCGMREFVFYTGEPQGMQQRFELLRLTSFNS